MRLDKPVKLWKIKVLGNLKTLGRLSFSNVTAIALLTTSFMVSAELQGPPQQLTAKTLSATQVSITWLPPDDPSGVVGYRIFRDDTRIGRTRETQFIDDNAEPNVEYRYFVTAFDQGKTSFSAPSNTDTIRTLINDENDGLRNGSVVRQGVPNLLELCGVQSVHQVEDENLNTCLDSIIELTELKNGLEDMRAFVARLRRNENPALINLGMRVFHSKSLSQNDDTACSSCHHPAVSCGGDNLSLPVGVNSLSPDMLGLGRSDGNIMPSVGRHSPHICNSAMWIESMFWDKRIAPSEPNSATPTGTVSTADIRTPEATVSNIINTLISNTDPARLLIAQAHFPITAPAEMGDPSGFESPQAYREHIANKLQENWGDEFAKAFDSNEVTMTRIAQSIAAYEASFLFTDNPFFSYVDGKKESLNEEAKRGALLFYTAGLNGGGCSNCHDGVFFTPEQTRGPLYPQIGPNAVADGNGNDVDDPETIDKNQFRMPSLLNIELTAPYGDKGVFPTLERVIHHYSNIPQSLQDFYNNNEVCDLPQFQHLTQNQCDELEGGGAEYVLELNVLQQGENGPGRPRNFTDEEVSYLVNFLKSLTDESARPGSPEINSLIPPRDAGPDGLQLNAIDQDGNPI